MRTLVLCACIMAAFVLPHTLLAQAAVLPPDLSLQDFLRLVATNYGAGGVIAALLFWFYRRDVRAYSDLWRGQSDAVMTVVKENTKAMAELRVEIQNSRDFGRRWSDVPTGRVDER